MKIFKMLREHIREKSSTVCKYCKHVVWNSFTYCPHCEKDIDRQFSRLTDEDVETLYSNMKIGFIDVSLCIIKIKKVINFRI